MVDVAFDLTSVFEDSPIVRLDKAKLKWITPRKHYEIIRAINKCGEVSAKSQNLKKVVTTYDKILDNPDEQALYLYWESNGAQGKILGYLKTARRNLYLQKSGSELFIVEPVCVLDFFVAEELQHHSYGKQLFDFMLEKEGVKPEQVAFDKPSDALLNFLTKNYELENPVWQSTNFVVFPAFFDHHTREVNADDGQFSARANKKPKAATTEGQTSGQRNHSRAVNDMAGDLIHCRNGKAEKQEYGPETPRGRKNTRDFGHSNIFG